MIGSRNTWLKKPEHFLRLALGGAALILVLKVLAYETGGGAGLLSDAAESILNMLTAFLGIYGTLWARLPRDEAHPYGHGKIESLFSGLQGLLLAITTGVLGYSILRGSYRPLHLENVLTVWLYEGIAMGINAALALLLLYGARRFHSQILRAESWHLLGDAATSRLVLGGIMAVWAGLPPLIDVGVGLSIMAFMGYGAFQLLRESITTLIDARDPSLMLRMAEALRKNRQLTWIDIHNVRIQRYGHAIHVDGHVTFPWYWSLREAHHALKGLEEALRAEFSRPVEFFWHMDPCEPICCPYCEVPDCPYRQAPFTQRLAITPDTLFLNQKGIR
ncbi:MAG: cation diffusion facilitator family transporter [Bacteroidia bacterium]|nr:cation diffusion facilitator family transporter [Bacteroidia bacterium]